MSALSEEEVKECQHDWRVNPFIMLTSNPPQRQLVCTHCGAIRASGFDSPVGHASSDPKTWPKWAKPVPEQLRLF